MVADKANRADDESEDEGSNQMGGTRVESGPPYHTAGYDPFIKSQLASRN